MTRAERVRIAAGGTGLAAVVATVLAIGGGHSAVAQNGAASSARERSAELTRAAGRTFADATARYDAGAEARHAAARMAPAVPLPQGGNFEGIRFEGVDGLTDIEVAHVLQYNAACQWLRAHRDGRQLEDARVIVVEAPEWWALRANGQREVLARAARELQAGGGPVAAGVLADCDAVHAREVAYAAGRGAVPSS